MSGSDVEHSFVTALLAVSGLLTAAFLLVREGAALALAAGTVLGVVGVAGLLLLARAVVLDARRGARR